ncbi:MAG: GYD domain-containing protein [Pirellula sp.]
MVRYLSLITFTEQGLKQIGQSPERAKTFQADIEAAGGRKIVQYWSLGEIDGCVVFEVPDDATAAALLLKLGKRGNVRTKTIRVFDESEFSSIAARS